MTEDIQEVRVSVPNDAALCAYRVAQEALNNAVKYAEASSIKVSLRETNQALVLTVSDDGRGFEIAGTGRRTGLGLASMRERIKSVDGQLDISSKVGHGTSIKASIPLTGERAS